jgi:hypothetical protein
MSISMLCESCKNWVLKQKVKRSSTTITASYYGGSMTTQRPSFTEDTMDCVKDYEWLINNECDDYKEKERVNND